MVIESKRFVLISWEEKDIDASINKTHMMLEVTNLGVDNIWIKHYDENILRKELYLPDNLVSVCLLPIGYKTKLYPPSPFYKIIKEIVEYE